MTLHTATPPPRPSLLARFGPLAVVLAAVAAMTVVASVGDDAPARELAAGDGAGPGGTNSDLPITWQEAEANGTTDEIEWGEDCDPETGRVRVPSLYAPPCVVARDGVAGGATYQGVTADTITVVLYEAADDDLAASLQDQNDTDEVQRTTRETFVRLFEDRFETWGRRVEVVFLKGSGSDETSSRADAVKVATEIGAFASIGGPAQEGAYAEELASRGVLCIGCGLAQPDSSFQEQAPFLWGQNQTPEQFLVNVGDYIIKRLLGGEAEFAGDPAFQRQERVFGTVHFEQDPPVFAAVEDEIRERGAEVGYVPAASLTYQLVISELAEKARTIVASLKEAGVTTVVFLGDPLMPVYLTQAATEQDYFPEWFITGTVLTDTTTFGRLYDQQQWSHAFGLSSSGVRVPPDQAEGWALYEWYTGAPPPATKTVPVLLPSIRHFMLGVHMAGPNLTPQTFRDGLFAYPVSGGNPTSPQYSFGDHDIFADPDYLAVDDMVEIWWDAEATGPDEQDVEGTGMMRYANGGRRYLPGEMTDDPPAAFVEEGSVTILDEVPEDQRPPDYPSPVAGGG